MWAVRSFKPCRISFVSVKLYRFLQESLLISAAQNFGKAKHDILLKKIFLSCQSPLHFLEWIFSSHSTSATFCLRYAIKLNFSSYKSHCHHSNPHHVGTKGVTICEGEDHQANWILVKGGYYPVNKADIVTNIMYTITSSYCKTSNYK